MKHTLELTDEELEDLYITLLDDSHRWQGKGKGNAYADRAWDLLEKVKQVRDQILDDLDSEPFCSQ